MERLCPLKWNWPVMQLYEKYPPPSSAPSVFTFIPAWLCCWCSCSDPFSALSWKSIIQSMNIYCSKSASQTLKYENRGSEAEAQYATLKQTQDRRQLRSASKDGGLLFAMLEQLIRRHSNYLSGPESQLRSSYKERSTQTTHIHIFKMD